MKTKKAIYLRKGGGALRREWVSPVKSPKKKKENPKRRELVGQWASLVSFVLERNTHFKSATFELANILFSDFKYLILIMYFIQLLIVTIITYSLSK